MKQKNIKKLLLLNLPYFLLGLYATKLGQAYRLATGADLSGKLLHLMEGFVAAFQSPFPSFHHEGQKRQEVSEKHGVRQRPLGNPRGHCPLR